jgi:hypothetical protein
MRARTRAGAPGGPAKTKRPPARGRGPRGAVARLPFRGEIIIPVSQAGWSLPSMSQQSWLDLQVTVVALSRSWQSAATRSRRLGAKELSKLLYPRGRGPMDKTRIGVNPPDHSRLLWDSVGSIQSILISARRYPHQRVYTCSKL